MKNNHFNVCIAIPIVFCVLAGVSIVLAITIGNLAGVWFLLLGMPWSIIPIESDTQPMPDCIFWIHALGSACINLIIISVVCWKNGHKPKNRK